METRAPVELPPGIEAKREDDVEEGDIPPGLESSVERAKSGKRFSLPRGILRRMSMMYAAGTNDQAGRFPVLPRRIVPPSSPTRPGPIDQSSPKGENGGAFHLLSEHPSLAIVPQSIRTFYLNLEEKIEEVEKESRRIANRELNLEILNSIETEEEREEAVALLESGKDLKVPHAIPQELTEERARRTFYRAKESERWFKDRKAEQKADMQILRDSLEAYVSHPILSGAVPVLRRRQKRQPEETRSFDWALLATMGVSQLRSKASDVVRERDELESSQQPASGPRDTRLKILRERELTIRRALRERYRAGARRALQRRADK